MKLKRAVIAAALGTAALFATSATRAALVLSAPEDFPGSGLGSVLTVLTLQGSPSETGGVFAAGAGFTITPGGVVKDGTSQTLLRTLGEAAITNVADLRVIFNASEPGSAGNSIALDALTLTFYTAAGTAIAAATQNLDMPYPFSNTESGTGNAGWVFSIANAPGLDAFLHNTTNTGGTAFGNIRVGLETSISNSAGGNETFFIARTVAPVPEPSTWAMLLAGLGMLGYMARRRAKQA